MIAGNGLLIARTLWTTFGGRALKDRAVFEARKRARLLHSRPTALHEPFHVEAPPDDWPFMIKASAIREATDRRAAFVRSERVATGEHQAFRWTWLRRPREAREWSTHPHSEYVYPNEMPWYRVRHFNPAAGDIKDVWEPARYGWAYDLMRGWIITGDDRYAQAFWGSFESFVAGCPPFLGVQWSCGQETAIRAIALLWSECAFREAPSWSSARARRLHEMLAWSGERIDDAFEYALSQRNNHGISEAAGLVAIGARLRGSHPRAEGWLSRGHEALERLVLDQFAPDGWYIQHSFNYARLALDQLVIAERVLRSCRFALSARAVERVRAGVRLLGSVTDPRTGEPPNHGANDGAYVLPLSTRAYRDFVPSLTAAAAVFREPLLPEMIPDGETEAWLGETAPRAPSPRAMPRVSTGASGWVSAETRGARLFARAGHYRSRPSHIDALHVDLWLGGRPVAVDAGTFRYAASSPWSNALAAAEVHNTITIEGFPSAIRGPRFLWLRWPSASVRSVRVAEGERVRVLLENESWRKWRIRHQRCCELTENGVLVIDEIRLPERIRPRVCIQWLIDGDADDLLLASPVPLDVVEQRGDAMSPYGWLSESYGDRRPVLSVRAFALPVNGVVRIATAFGDARSSDTLDRALRISAERPADPIAELELR